MAIFSEYMLLTTALYFLFLTLCTGEVTRRQHLWIGILSFLAPYVYFPILPAFFTGVSLILLFRVYQLPERRLRPAIAEVWKLRYFAIAPIMFFLASLTEPWNLGHRPSRAPFFFSSSGYPHTFLGATEYAWNGTVHLFGKLISVKTGLSHSFDLILGVLCLLLCVVGILQPGFVRRINLKRALTFAGVLHIGLPEKEYTIDVKRNFTSAYVVIITIGILLLSLLDQYPYGTPRYTLYLLIPVLVLAAYGLTDLGTVLLIKPWEKFVAYRDNRSKRRPWAIPPVLHYLPFLSSD
jgi:hypothetical protein